MNKRVVSIIFLLISWFGNAQNDFCRLLADSALVLTHQHVEYDASYFRLDYPNGDVPKDKGVCTDVIIRAYRLLGVDLQKEVHEDMVDHFDVYPKLWGLSHPDKNIDHRRVSNLMTFFSRKGISLPVSQNSNDYKPGDIVCWNLGNGITHIGIVSAIKNKNAKRYMIIHNIGRGQVLEDMLFDFTIIGHYRYKG